MKKKGFLIFGAILAVGILSGCVGPGEDVNELKAQVDALNKKVASVEASAASKKELADMFNVANRSYKLWDIQEGAADNMKLIGDRHYYLHFAGKAKNWELAEHEVHEIEETMEKLMVTRPKLAPMLEAYKNTYLKELDEAVDSKDIAKFEAAYKKSIDGCNACHVANKKEFAKIWEHTQPPPEVIKIE